MKICNRCKIEKHNEDYHKDKSSKDGLTRTCKICRIENTKKWNSNNQERRKNYMSDYIKLNKELLNKYNQQYREDNKPYFCEYNKNYYKNRYNNDSLFKLKEVISSNIRNNLKKYKYTKSDRTNNILGCSYEFLYEYLESKFESWMSWENQGYYNGEFNYGWDIDHIIPLRSASSEEEIIKLNHYTNLQPLCSKVNRDIKK